MVKIKLNHILILALLCFMIIDLIFRHDLRESKKNVEEKQNEVGFLEKKNKTIEEYIDYSLELGFQYNGRNLDNQIITGGNFEDTYFKNANIVRPCLVFCFSETHCHNCIETAINHIGQYFTDINKIVVLGAFSNTRDLNIFMTSFAVKLNTFRTPPVNSLVDIKSFKTPCFFLLSPEDQISNFFVYDEKYLDRLDKYLKQSYDVLQ